MSIQLTTAEAQEAQGALLEMAQERVSVTTALKIKHLLRAVSQQINDANEVKQERLTAFLETHGLELDDKGSVKLETTELQDEWTATLSEVMAATVEYDRWFEVDEMPATLVGAIVVGLGPLLVEEPAS